MPTIPEHLIGEQCELCGYAFRKNDRAVFEHGGDHLFCEAEKNCRRRQRTPKPEYANPNATADEMLDKIAATLTDEAKTLMLNVSEDEDLMRYVYRECFNSGKFVKSWKR